MAVLFRDEEIYFRSFFFETAPALPDDTLSRGLNPISHNLVVQKCHSSKQDEVRTDVFRNSTPHLFFVIFFFVIASLVI
jgi:hypothetical protein